MKTLICPTCGCSLVRLGVRNDQATVYRTNGDDYNFCCQGCVDVFITDPRKYLKETKDMIVCPTCLAEKPPEQAVKVKIAGQDVHFCRCQHCQDAFRKDPNFYIRRLEGTVPNQGVVDSEGCCVRPLSGASLTPSGGDAEVESCCEFHPPVKRGPTKCPSCGVLARPVQRQTVGALLKPDRRAEIPHQDEFCFCRTPDCDVVYFRANEVLFRKGDVRVRVHQKEPNDPKVLVCYCFDWTPEKIRAQLERAGKSTAVDEIKAQVKAGNCYCEVTNPQGTCCLGNVAKVVEQKGVIS